MNYDFTENSEYDFENRMVAPEYTPEDAEVENPLRPKRLTEYIGQEKVKENLSVFIEAARLRKESLDHVLLYGPPGLGKTTLAGVIANEMNVNVRITSGPAIEKPGDLAALLTNLNEGDVLFYRRDSPSFSQRRRNFVSCNGRLCTGYYYRKRSNGSFLSFASA